MLHTACPAGFGGITEKNFWSIPVLILDGGINPVTEEHANQTEVGIGNWTGMHTSLKTSRNHRKDD